MEKLHEEFEAFNKMCDKAKELLYMTCRNEMKGHCLVNYFNSQFEEISNLSPVEQILQVAFWVFEETNRERISVCLSMERQKEIICGGKKYIADFFIESWQQFYTKNNKTYWHDFKAQKPIIIECDGFEYHSSKQQMQNDYERENDLKNAGYDILRFTGSQIYSQPLQTVEKIIDYLKKNSFEQ